MFLSDPRLVVETPPSEEPVSFQEAKEHVVASDGFDEDLIGRQIVSAREWVENYLKRSLVTRTFQFFLDGFPLSEKVFLPFPPISSVSSVSYLDEDGVSEPVPTSDYQLSKRSDPPFLVPAYEKKWPSPRKVYEAVTIEYVAGYGAASDVPQAIKQAMLLILGQTYNQREEMMPSHLKDAPLTAKNLLNPFRQPTI